MKTTYIAAFVVAALFIAWLLSGQFDAEQETGPAPSLAESRDAMLAQEEDEPTRVRARVIAATSQTADVIVRGRTEADRSVTLRAETAGRIEDLPLDKGDAVDAGDLICRIATDSRDARVEEARAAVVQAQLEFEGAEKLQERGFQSETAIAGARARLAASQANLRERELDLERTYVRAPFAGIIETRGVEIGDYIQPGGICATIIDADPMMLVGEVAERDVGRLETGAEGYGKLITGEQVHGTIAFVARAAASTTRTFRIEVAVPNATAELRDGITTEIVLPVERFPAHNIPASILVLDDAGELGVRILDADNIVRLVNVSVVKNAGNGIWVRGLPDPATVITVGQELVSPGERAEVSFEARRELPASAPREDTELPPVDAPAAESAPLQLAPADSSAPEAATSQNTSDLLTAYAPPATA